MDIANPEAKIAIMSAKFPLQYPITNATAPNTVNSAVKICSESCWPLKSIVLGNAAGQDVREPTYYINTVTYPR